MSTIISFCGMECSSCPAYIATQENNDELRKKTAEEWAKLFKMDVSPEDINCDGCTVEGAHSAYCNICEIRKCGTDRGLQSCAFCDDYGCEKLVKVHQMEPACRKRLDELRSR